ELARWTHQSQNARPSDAGDSPWVRRLCHECSTRSSASPAEAYAIRSGPSSIIAARLLSAGHSRQGRELLAPAAGPEILTRSENVLLGDEEALRPGHQIGTVAAQAVADALRRPAGEDRRPRHPGVERRGVDVELAERGQPLPQARSLGAGLQRHGAPRLAGH